MKLSLFTREAAERFRAARDAYYGTDMKSASAARCEAALDAYRRAAEDAASCLLADIDRAGCD